LTYTAVSDGWVTFTVISIVAEFKKGSFLYQLIHLAAAPGEHSVCDN